MKFLTPKTIEPMNKSIGLSVVFGFLALILIAAFALSVAAQEANAASGINKSINYQGKLMDSAGNSVSDGIYNIKFTLYDAGTGGTQLWSASTTNGLPGGTPALTAVQVTNGLFSILLGDQDLGHVTIPEEIFNNDNVYLGVTIESDTEMLPRKRLSAVPYAFNAGALQGQKASSSVDNTGGELFRLSQIATDSASATRTALLIETYGTSNQYDFLLRLSDGTQDVFLVNRQGNVTTTGAISIGTALLIGGIQLDAIGSSATTSGAYLVGAYDEFTYSNATTVQGVLADLDLTLNSVSSSANTLTLQNVTDNGSTTTNPIVFAGGTSTGDLMPGAHLTYDLGRPGMRWDELYTRKIRIGQNSWTQEVNASNTFMLSEDTYGTFFAITENGRVGIGTSTPKTFTLEVDGAVGPTQNNMFDLGSDLLAWRNITAAGTVSSSDAVFGNITAGNLEATGYVSTTDLYIDGVLMSTTTPNLDEVTSQGNLTTNSIEFAGGTSTDDFLISGNLSVTGTSDLQHIDFITATGTALQLTDHLYLGDGTDSDVDMISVDTGDGSDNPSLKYYSNYYGYKGLIWHNPDSGESSMLASQSENDDAEILAITGDRASNAVFNLYSDTDGFSSFSGLRGWEVGRRGSDATFDFTFYNSDTGDGRSTVGPYQLLTLSGFDSEMILNGSAIFNEGGDDYDFRVEGDTEEYLLFIDASTERIGMGTSTPSEKLHVEGNVFASGNVSSTNSLFINSTGTNLALLGYVNSDLSPQITDTYSLGDLTHRWLSLFAQNVQTVNVSSTNIDALGYVSTTDLYINGQKLDIEPNIFQGTQETAFNDSTIDNWESITLNHNILDSNYTHSNGSSTVTITATGTYRISGHVVFARTGTDNGRSVAKTRINKNNGTIITDIIYAYSRNTNSDEGTATIPDTVVELNTGDYLDLQGAVHQGTGDFTSLSASLLIEKVLLPGQSGGGGSGSAGTLQEVTDLGAVTTNAIQFAGGTSTDDFNVQGDLAVGGSVSSTSALFINATGTNLALLGYVNSDLNPQITDTYSLGDASRRWLGLNVANVSSTNIDALGYVSTTELFVNGNQITGGAATFQEVTNNGNSTTNTIQFAGGTSTASLLPGTADAYDLGSVNFRWRDIYANTLQVGTSTLWDLSTATSSEFIISNSGGEQARISTNGNFFLGIDSYSSGLDTAFSPDGDDMLASGDIGALGSVYSANSFYAGVTSTIYSKDSLYKQDGGDYLFQFANVAASPSLITGFESSVPPSGWTTGGNANWFQDSTTSTEGSYSAESGDIADYEISYIETNYTFASDGLLQFDWRVSSEATYDFLLFCLDDAVNCTDTGGGDYSRISGETQWATVSVPITAGTHNLRWAYDKDYSVTNGDDAGWIDNVRFSPYSGQNWRFFTDATERLTVAYSGNVGIGVSAPEAKLDINGETRARGNVNIAAAPSKTEIAWATANSPSTGIESVRSLVSFNGYLYAGQGDDAGDGDIQVCNPAGGGDSTLCDNAADWSASYSTASYSQVLSMIVYKGKLYAGLGDGAGLGDVLVCDPTSTGSTDVCDTGDWSDANFPAGPNRITRFIEYNGYLYAANDDGTSGSASVAVCDPAGGGNVNTCDNASDWTNIAMPDVGYEELNTLTIYQNKLYAFVGNSIDDLDWYICSAAEGGSSSLCDNSNDWSRPFDNTVGDYNSTYAAAVYNNYLYMGAGSGNGDGDLMMCDSDAGGDDLLCDDLNDFNILIDNGNGINSISALMSYDGSLFVGLEGTNNNGDIIELRGADYKTSEDGTGFEATYAFAELNGVLYAGRGNSTGNGQIYYYQKARESSYALKMEAGSSTGSMWFSSESLNYQGAGTGYDTQTGAFKFSHGIITEAGAYDLAEMYPTLQADIAAGDVVTLDKENSGYIKKTTSAYEKSILGVVSTKPGFLLSSREKGKDMRAVALVGRVPVKVSLENGDISIGDPLTSASLEGHAMKATEPGMIIGHAMESFVAATTSASGTEMLHQTGSVLMVVQTGYYFGNEDTSLGQIAGFLGESTTTQIVQQAFDGDAYAIEQVAGGMINPQIAEGDELNGFSAAQLDVLIVKTAALVAGDLTVGGETNLLGHVIVTNDTAGVVDLPAGQDYVEIQFTNPFENAPVVVVTPESDAEEYFNPWLGKFRVAKKSVNGFRIEVDEGACLDPSNCGRTMKFNWIAVGVKQEQTEEKNSTTTEAVLINEGDNGVEENESVQQILSDEELLNAEDAEDAQVVVVDGDDKDGFSEEGEGQENTVATDELEPQVLGVETQDNSDDAQSELSDEGEMVLENDAEIVDQETQQPEEFNDEKIEEIETQQSINDENMGEINDEIETESEVVNE